MSILAQVVEYQQKHRNCLGHTINCDECPGQPWKPGYCFGLKSTDNETFEEVWDRITAEAVRRLSMEQLSKI